MDPMPCRRQFLIGEDLPLSGSKCMGDGVCRLEINPEDLGHRSKRREVDGQLNGKWGTAIEAIDAFQSIPLLIDRIRFVGRTFVWAIPKD